MSGENGEQEVRTFTNVMSRAETWKTLWQDLGDYLMPRKSAILERRTPDVEGWTDNIYNNDGVHANRTSAGGTYDFLYTGQWFDFNPPPALKGNARAKRYYSECAEVARYDIANSNFKTTIHEKLLDRGAFGTAHIHLEEGKRNFLSFTGADVGSFFCEEDSEGQIERIWTIYENMTACQIVEEFTDGEDLSKLPETVMKDYRDPNRMYNKHPVIHSVRPRMPKEMNGTLLPEDKPIASIWTHRDSKTILRNSGYDETGDFVSRYLKWGGEVYGYCPGVEVLPVVKQLNFIEMLLDAQAEIKTFPRMLWPHNMSGNIQMGAGGVTFIDPNNAASNDLPREWMTGGDLGDMSVRLETKKQAVDRAYDVELFKALAAHNNNMTATEVVERVAEKLVNFSPTYGRLTDEWNNPILRKVWAMELKAGRFPDAPPEVVQLDAQGVPGIEHPSMVYTSKVAMALNALENRNFVEYMQIMMPVFEAAPSTAVVMNWEATARKIGDNLGLPVEMFQTEEVVASLQAEAAQVAQAQQAAEVANTGAQAAETMSRVDPAKLQDMAEQAQG
jgi:hypothetical protein